MRTTLASSIIAALFAGTLAAPAFAANAMVYRVPLAPTAKSGPPGELSISSADLSFTAQQVNFGQETRIVTLTNVSDRHLSIGSVVASSTDFPTSSNCNQRLLAPAGRCQVSVTFRPSGNAGVKSGSVHVAHSGTGPADIALQGEAMPASLTVPTAITFGNVAVGDTGEQALQIANTGYGPVSVGLPSVLSGTAFVLRESNCPTTLDAGLSCSYKLGFSPASRGAASSSIARLTSGAGTFDVALSGTGLQGTLQSSASGGLAFGSVLLGASASSELVTLSNNGDLAVSGMSFNLTDGYTLDNGSCGTTLAVGGSCNFKVKFKPTEARAYPGTVTVSGSRGEQTLITLGGTGVKAEVSAGNALDASYAVGRASASGSTLKVVNSGSVPVTVTGLTVANKVGAFSATFSGACAPGTVLPAGGVCNVWTSGDGAAGSTHSGQVTVATNGGDITFTRTFNVVDVTVTAANLNPAVGGSTSAVRITISNPSTVPFQVKTYNSGPVFGGSAQKYGVLSGLNVDKFAFWQSSGCALNQTIGKDCVLTLSTANNPVAGQTYSTYYQMLGGFPKTDSGVVVGTIPEDNTALWAGGQVLISYKMNP